MLIVSPSAVVVVGFASVAYSVSEGGQVAVCVEITTGTLGRDITLNIVNQSGQTTGQLTHTTNTYSDTDTRCL